MLDALRIQRADLVTHDNGNMIGYAFAAQHPIRVTRFALLDALLPGIGPWEIILESPLLWHFRFAPDMERLVAGRERICRPSGAAVVRDLVLRAANQHMEAVVRVQLHDPRVVPGPLA